MHMRLPAAPLRKSVISSITVASLTSLVLLSALEIAVAKPMSRCQVKFTGCSERCIMKNMNDGVGNCISRTCNHQYQACARGSGESSDPYHDHHLSEASKGGKGGKGGRATRSATPLQGDSVVPRPGMARGNPGFGRGPAATGIPMQPRQPSAGRVIIR